jgi:hypothetical protein
MNHQRKQAMNDNVQESFDYGVLNEAQRIHIQVKAESIKARMKRTAEDIIAIGCDLREVKEELDHGQFKQWIKAEFAMSYDTALNFMQVAKKFAERIEYKNGKFPFLPASVLYELATPSTPDTIIEQVQSREIPATLEAIKAAKEAQRQAEQAEQQARAETQATQRQLFALQQELASRTEPKVQVIEKPVVPEEITKQLEQLQQNLEERTKERNNLAAVRETLSQALNEKRSLEKEQHEQELYERRIRQNWQHATDTFTRAVLALLAQFPSVFDAAQCFDATDWTRLDHVIEVAQRFQTECQKLKTQPTSVIVEAGR